MKAIRSHNKETITNCLKVVETKTQTVGNFKLLINALDAVYVYISQLRSDSKQFSFLFVISINCTRSYKPMDEPMV